MASKNILEVSAKDRALHFGIILLDVSTTINIHISNLPETHREPSNPMKMKISVKSPVLDYLLLFGLSHLDPDSFHDGYALTSA